MIIIICGALLMTLAVYVLTRAQYFDDKATWSYYPDQDSEFLSLILYVIGYILVVGSFIILMVGTLS